MINDELVNVSEQLNNLLAEECFYYYEDAIDQLVKKRDELLKQLKKEKKDWLQPIYDSAKSFYKKAYIECCNDKQLLYSYGTLVLTYNIANGTYMLNDVVPYKLLFSQTTSRHILEFLNQKNYVFEKKGKTRKETLLLNSTGGIEN